MGSRALAAIGAVALLIGACGSSGTSTPSPTLGGGPVPGTSDAPPTAPPGSADTPASQDTSPAPTDSEPSGDATRLVILHGTFTGHGSDPLASADQTVELELHWNAGPDDVHDAKAFKLVSGTFTFSEEIDGVCGGSRSEAGDLTPWSDTFLISGDIQDRDQASVTLVDARLSSGAVELSLTSSFAVSAPDPGVAPTQPDRRRRLHHTVPPGRHRRTAAGRDLLGAQPEHRMDRAAGTVGSVPYQLARSRV